MNDNMTKAPEKRKSAPRRKKKVTSKTLQKLQKVRDIVTDPTSQTPKKWVSWLRRYTFPKKYIVLMILSGLLGSMSHPVTRNLIFMTLGKYFPTRVQALGKLQIVLETALDTTKGETRTFGEAIRNFPSLWASHTVGVLLENPKNIAYDTESNKRANELAMVIRDFFSVGMRRCKTMAEAVVEEFTDNDDLKELIHANILDPKYKDRFSKYASVDDVSPATMQQRLLFWTVKACELDVLSKRSGARGVIAGETLEHVADVIIPSFKQTGSFRQG